MKDCQYLLFIFFSFKSLLNSYISKTFIDPSPINVTILHLIEHKRVEKLLISFLYLKINKYNKYKA